MVFDHKCASQILAELANKYIIHKQGPDIALFFIGIIMSVNKYLVETAECGY